MDFEEWPSVFPVKRMMKLLWVGFCCVLVGCSTLPTGEEYRRDLEARLRGVVVEDGINEQESKVIAEAYLAEHQAGPGGPIGPYDGGAAWSFTLTGCFGNEFTNVPPVLVDKRTGVVTWEAGAAWKK